MPTPKITLDNFGLAGNKTTHWLENFSIAEVGGKKVLRNDWDIIERVDNDATTGSGFTNLNTIQAFGEWTDATGDTFLTAFDGTQLFLLDDVVTSFHKGEIHGVANTVGTGDDEIWVSNYGDTITTKEGHLLYTSANHVGIGWYGTCKTGSDTEKIVDAGGRDMQDDYGVYNSTDTPVGANSKLYNIENEEEYTVTSISTTDSTNDTMNFTAGTANGVGDEYWAFVDNGWTGTASFKFSTENGVRDYHYLGQPAPENWRRQIKVFGQEYVILNGNYLATLNVDLATWAPTAKIFDAGSPQQAMCMDVNNGKLLVGTEYRYKGRLYLWDSYTSGWNSIQKVDNPVYAIKEYSDGWIYLSGNTLYYTDGNDSTELSQIPDADRYAVAPTTYNFNSLEILDNKVFVVGMTYNYNRTRCGIYVYDIDEKGWSFVPNLDKSGNYNVEDTVSTALYNYTSNNRQRIYCSGINNINYIWGNASQPANGSALFYIQLPEKMRLSEVELNLSYNTSEKSGALDDTENIIWVSCGDGRRPLWTYGQATADSTTTAIINSQGANTPAKVGQEILIVDGTNAPAGETRFITGITNAGTSTETYSINAPLSADITGSTSILIQDLYRAGRVSHTWSSSVDMLKTLRFSMPDFYSDKLWIKVRFDNNSTNLYTMEIHSINIY